MLQLEDDLAAEWLLDLWQAVSTADKAARLRETTIAKLLKRNRIRRFGADRVLEVLRQPPMKVTTSTVEAAQAHVATLIASVRLVNRQLKEAHQRLDTLTARLIPTEAEPGQRKQHDVEILASLPGVGRIVLATLFAEAFNALQRRDYTALRSLTGVATVTERSGKKVRLSLRPNRRGTQTS
jgi:transposase